MCKKPSPMSVFSKPAFGRFLPRLLSGVFLITIAIGVEGSGVENAIKNPYFWLIAVMSLHFFFRSFVVGLKYRNQVFVYRSYFTKRVVPIEEVSYFIAEDTDDKFYALLGAIGELLGVPTMRLSNGNKINLWVCSLPMWKIDKKLVEINSVVDPEWTPPTSVDDPDASEWLAVKELGREMRDDQVAWFRGKSRRNH